MRIYPLASYPAMSGVFISNPRSKSLSLHSMRAAFLPNQPGGNSRPNPTVPSALRERRVRPDDCPLTNPKNTVGSKDLGTGADHRALADDDALEAALAVIARPIGCVADGDVLANAAAIFKHCLRVNDGPNAVVEENDITPHLRLRWNIEPEEEDQQRLRKATPKATPPRLQLTIFEALDISDLLPSRRASPGRSWQSSS